MSGVQVKLTDKNPAPAAVFSIQASAETSEADWIELFQAEVDNYRRQMTTLTAMDAAQVLMALSAWGARVSEIRSQIYRSDSRKATAFRTRDLDPFLDQCEFQFKVWSRIVSLRQQEWDIAKG